MSGENHPTWSPLYGWLMAATGAASAMSTEGTTFGVGGILIGLTGAASIAYSAISKIQDARVKRLMDDQAELRKMIEDKDGFLKDRESFWKQRDDTHEGERQAFIDRCNRLEDRIRRIEGERDSLMGKGEEMARHLSNATERLLSLTGKFTADALPLIPAPTIEGPRAILVDGPPIVLKLLLIVEDNDVVRQTLADLLPLYAPNRLRIEQAVDLADGLKKLENKPDAILLDLMLPDGDGVEVLKAVRERALTTRVYITTGRHPDTLGYINQYHPDRVFIKPTPAATVIRAVLEGLK